MGSESPAAHFGIAVECGVLHQVLCLWAPRKRDYLHLKSLSRLSNHQTNSQGSKTTDALKVTVAAYGSVFPPRTIELLQVLGNSNRKLVLGVARGWANRMMNSVRRRVTLSRGLYKNRGTRGLKKRLLVGYVSADFRDHALGRAAMAMLRLQFEGGLIEPRGS